MPRRSACLATDGQASLPGDSECIAYGLLPYALFEEIRGKFTAAIRARRAGIVR